MKILVTTPNGRIGRRIITELLAPEFSVRVLARNTSCLPEQIRKRVEVVHGATDDYGMLRQALDGVEALFWCVPLESLQEANARGYYERVAHAGCRAIREAGTSRVVTISALGNTFGRGPIFALRAMEDILNQCGAAIRHLRCGWFMENFLRQAHSICGQGILTYPVQGQIGLPMVAARDIAEVVLQRLVRRDWTGIRSTSILGPGDLSFNQAAFTLERVLNRRVRYTEVCADDFIRYLVRSGASIHYARSAITMLAGLVDLPRGENRTAELIGSTSLAEWTKRVLLPLMRGFGPQAGPDSTPAPIGKAELGILLAPHAL